ncbi:putative glycolipid-binding domain-containing protein [Bosea sp. 685]|uniref:putative glycolipid-binding domain-containing protein n=1 Tax=Bosea sp. 685 TaxID=3080057 RepID=UPI0028934093|nr:putative glycolipid-binding domain-containing protein [Bosea sp. 685]WNJ91887.1 putative glycolipid-binding domain-containing protein [Bosea sp. 685]
MSFRPVQCLEARRSVRWQGLGGEGLEHLTISATAETVHAEAVVIGARGGTPYGVTYKIACDLDFSVRSFAVSTTDGRGLEMTRRDGAWYDSRRGHLPDFDGCIDIDLAGTPFTNTLPIRRAAWQTGTEHGFTMLYVSFGTFEPSVDAQTYACLGPRLFRYKAADRSFTADLPVDEDGLVMDYPTLFQRL